MNINNPKPVSDEVAYLRIFAILAIIVMFSMYIVQNPTPWSPLGESNSQQRENNKKPTVIEMPPGWGPATIQPEVEGDLA